MARQHTRRARLIIGAMIIAAVLVVLVAEILPKRTRNSHTSVAEIADLTPPGHPVWLSVGGMVYHEGDADPAGQEVLSFGRTERWFKGFTRRVSQEQFDAATHRIGMQSKIQFQGEPMLADPMPYPESLAAVPLDDRGVRLSLNLDPAVEANVIQLTVTLQSDHRSVSREVEHRWTMILPMLFAIYVDGNPIASRPANQMGEIGGSVSANPIIPEGGGSRVWHIRLNESSARALLPDAGPHVLQIAAAFSERQHEDHEQGGEFVQRLEVGAVWGEDPPRQVLVRSRLAGTLWTGTHWVKVNQ